MADFIVTAAPPNPNGDLHLGHLAGPFLTADIVARALDIQGHSVSHVGYIDEHSSYVVRRARELSTDPYTAAAALGDRIETTLTLANMRPKTVTRPLRDPSHDQQIHAGFLELWTRGHITVEEDSPVLYCTICDRELYECEVRGHCQFCAAPSDGIYCEQCGQPQISGDLADPRCTKCDGTEITVTNHPRLILHIESLRETLCERLSEITPRPRFRDYIDTLLSSPLAPVPISRRGQYGPEVPLEGWSGHFLDTWFSGVFGYINAAKLDNYRRRRFDTDSPWTDPDIDVIEAFGFDCSFSHVILWNALAIWLDWPLRTNYLSNEFYQLEGQKFSTSRGHAIWGADFLPTTSSDILRFYMALTGPEVEQTSFGAADYEQFSIRYRAGIEALFHAATDHTRPAVPPTWRVRDTVEDIVKRCHDAYLPHTFSARSAARILTETVIDSDDVSAQLRAAAPEDREPAFLRLIALFYPLSPYWTTDLLVQFGVNSAITLAELTQPATSARIDSTDDHSNRTIVL